MTRLALKYLTILLAVLSISLSPLHSYAQNNISNAAGATDPTVKGDPTDPTDSAKEDLGLVKSIDAEFNELQNAKTKGDKLGMKVTGFESIAKETKNYVSDEPTCVSTHSGAAYACLENLSPNILTGVTTLNTLLSTIGSVAVKDQCSKFASAMDIAKAAMTAYTAACGAAKAGCGFYCVSARNSIKKVLGTKSVADCSGAGQQMAACNEAQREYTASLGRMTGLMKQELGNNKKSMSGKAALCTEKYANLLTSAVAGIAGLMNSIKQGKECEEESAGDTAQAGADPLKEKCSDPANAQLPECICLKNPRTPGCSNAYQKPGELSSGGAISTGATDRTNVAAAGGGPDLGPTGGPGMEQREPNSTGSDGGVGAPAGGGGAGLGGGGLSGGGAAGGDKSENAKKGLDTNILAGTGGGGGGGGWGSGGGSSAGNSKYSSYLPGGKNDPNKGMAGSQAWTKEVTGQGGKSNWDKVKERYRDNKSTLLGN